MVHGKAFRLICHKKSSSAAAEALAGQVIRKTRHCCRAGTAKRVALTEYLQDGFVSQEAHLPSSILYLPFPLCSQLRARRARAERRLPNATSDRAFVSHAGNSTIGSNFCQGPLERILKYQSGAVMVAVYGEPNIERYPDGTARAVEK